MEDAKSERGAGPPETTGPQNSLDSGTISKVVGEEEAGKECVPSESSTVSPLPAVVAAPPATAEQPLLEVKSERDENEGVASVEGATVAAVVDQEPVGEAKASVSQSTSLDEPSVQLLADACTGGTACPVCDGRVPLLLISELSKPISNGLSSALVPKLALPKHTHARNNGREEGSHEILVRFYRVATLWILSCASRRNKR